MTNFEKWKDEILKLSEESKVVAVKLDGSPIDCDILDNCHECKLNQGIDINNQKSGCGFIRIRWLYEEYIEPIKLTHKQLAILEILETGWLARDDTSNILYWYSEKPKRVNWHFENASDKSMCASIRGVFDAFDFITFKDEPYSVEEMLT